MFSLSLASVSQGADWVLDNDGDWNNDSNWANPGTFPNAAGAVADFSVLDLTSSRTVSLNVPTTVGTLLFGDSTGTSRYDINNGSAGSLTFDNGGTSLLTRVNSGSVRFENDIILNDMLVVDGAIETLRSISGTGGMTINSGKSSIRQSTNSYTGLTIVNSNASVLVFTINSVPQGGMIFNGNGQFHGYYLFTMTLDLGSGPGTIRFPDSSPGTASGFEWNNNMHVRFNNDANTVVQWGGGDFDMETFRLKNTGGTHKTITFHNILDLNGGDRSIQVQSTTNLTDQYAIMAGEIRDVAGGGSLTKTGNGRLVLNVPNYDGDTMINQGVLELGAPNSANDGADIIMSDSAMLTLDFAGADTVYKFIIGDEQYYTGQYGHTDSGVGNGGLGIGALDAWLGAGNGILDVKAGPSGTLITLE